MLLPLILFTFTLGEMNTELSNLIAELEKVSADTQEKFGALSNEQLNWKPAENSWSVGQCFDHLIRSNMEMEPVVKLVDGTSRMNFWEKVSPFSGMLGGFLVSSMMKDERKFKAPSKAIVPPSDVPADVVAQFIEQQAGVIDTIKAADKFDWKKTRVTSPFMSLITYSLNDAFKIVVEHEKRHMRQAARVMQADGFPR